MISIKELTKYFDSTCAVDRLSFDIHQGQILGLLGPNGAGKSTTLRILTGYLKPTSGTVLIKDIDVRQDPLKAKRLIGYLPESSPLYPDMLVYDYLDFIAEVRGIAKHERLNRLRSLADLCAINEVMHMPVNTVSRGYNQRVGLALAMMSDPEILILDEPTSGLDPNQIVEIRSIIKEIGKEKTVILSTHILSEAEATCDRVVIINRGKRVADGSADMLKISKSGEIDIRLTLLEADAKEVQDFFASIEEIVKAAVERNEDRLEVRLTCTKDLRAEIYGRIKKKDWVLLELAQEKKSLEHIFSELTKEN